MSPDPSSAFAPSAAEIFGRARWIWPDSHHWDLHNCYALFRRAFTLADVPARAPLFLTADQSYRLYVNGRFVSRGPARGYQHAWPYDELDLAPWLRPGRNVLALRAYNPGSSNFQYLTQGYAGLLLAAHWPEAGLDLVSDARWRTLRQPGVSRDTIPTSLQLFPQEHLDLRALPADWSAPDFDDSAWAAPAERPWNSGPWFGLQPRGIPLLQERRLEPVALLGLGSGPSADGYENVRDVVALRLREDRAHLPVDAARADDFRPLHVTSVRRGEFRSHLFDFGRTQVGNLALEITGALGGETIDTHYAETLDATTLTLDQIATAGSRMAFGDRLVLRPGAQTHRFYHHYGFRYLEITVRDAPAGLRLSLSLDWIGYPLDRRGAFAGSDPLLEQIWEACAWTQQCCSLDAYVDTPWREQAQWWGDARVQAWNTFHLSGDARLFRRGIAQIAAQTTPDGLTYGHAPTMAHGCILPDFTLIWFLTLWDYYWQTGSIEPVLTHRDTIRRALDYFRRHTDPRSGLVTHDDRFWLFLDWTELHKDGAPSILNLWLLLALEKLARLFRLGSLSDDAARLEDWADRLRAALASLVGPDGLLHDGLDRSGQRVPATSIHSQVLGHAAAIPGLDAYAADARLLLPFLRGELQPAAQPSAYWITYVFSHLAARGHGAAVLDFIRRAWAPMAAYGTTWENFAPKRADESHSHAWSAHPLYHLAQIIGGIHQSAPAWAEIEYRPVFHGAHARVVVPTPHGDITSLWRRDASGAIHLQLRLPPGVRAHLQVPGLPAETVSGDFTATLGASSPVAA